MKEKFWKYVQFVFYVAVGVAILAFREALEHRIGYLVGGVMLLYAVEGILTRILHHDVERHLLTFIDEVILLILAVLMVLVRDNLDKTCVIWAIWSILREGEEISEVLKRYRSRLIWCISLAESVIVIFLSSLLVLQPLEHAGAHVTILGIEMILEVLFPLLDRLAEEREDREREQAAKP